jgi:hypothetical protein
MTRAGIFITLGVLFALLGGVRSSATVPVSITILTLDNRPPNDLFIKELAAVAGVDVQIGFDPSMASTADCVSINTAVAGSLVGSRSVDPWTLTPPEVRPDSLLHLAIPRVEPTVTESGLVQEYARVREILADPAVQNQVLDAIRGNSAVLDDPVLSSYVNRIKGWLDFLDRAGYDPDRLLITLDDNRPGPLSDGLKLLLKKYSNHVQDGTDEGMMLLFARALIERREAEGRPVTCGIVWTSPEDLLKVQPFESAMVVENLLSITDWLNLRISPNIDLVERWRPVLWVHGSGSDEIERSDMIQEVSETLGDRPVIVADIAKANMGDDLLIDSWSYGYTPRGLIGYLGWNTSSNTLGSAVALWACADFGYSHGADPEGVRAAMETFLWARFLDDYYYQAHVRELRREIARAAGEDIYHLTPEQTAREEAAIAARLTELWRNLGVNLAIPLRYVDPLGHTTFTVELPWNRFFEIALYPSDDRGILPVIRPREGVRIVD